MLPPRGADGIEGAPSWRVDLAIVVAVVLFAWTSRGILTAADYIAASLAISIQKTFTLLEIYSFSSSAFLFAGAIVSDKVGATFALRLGFGAMILGSLAVATSHASLLWVGVADAVLGIGSALAAAAMMPLLFAGATRLLYCCLASLLSPERRQAVQAKPNRSRS